MYKMGKKEIVLDPNTVTYDEYDNAIYSVGNYKIKLFSSLSKSISEHNCLKLAQVKTKRIILPSYPIYHDTQYCGCAYKGLTDDWIESFFGQGKDLRQSLILMKNEIIELSQLGIDFVEMKSYKSSGDFYTLKFHGTDRIQDSQLSPQRTIQKNLSLYHDYLRNLVYNGMCEFSVDPDDVDEYLTISNPITTALENALNQSGVAGDLISIDIKKKVKK